MERLQGELQERYLVNCSFFQSIPDYWGLKQRFPIMPIHHLQQKSIQPASILDITCDSDGEISFSPETPLYLHDIDLDKDDYYLAFFNIGAYQEILGMSHNLFTHPDEVIINIESSGFKIDHVQKAKNIEQIHNNLGYDNKSIFAQLKANLQNSHFSDEKNKTIVLKQLHNILQHSSYLQTIK